MEMKYKVRVAITLVTFTCLPVIYGLCERSDEANATLAAAVSIPLIVLWVYALALVGTGVEWCVKYLLKKGGR